MTLNIDESTLRRELPDPTTKVSVSENDELDVWVLGEGEPIVFVHGGVIRDLLLPLAIELTRRGGYQVIHYGRRGHGGRGLPYEAADIPAQSADVVAILDALGIAKAHVAGHSFGGYVALEVATRAPDRVESAILMEPLFAQALSPATQREFQQVAEVGFPMVAEMYMGGEADRAVTTFCDLTSGIEGSTDLFVPVLPEGTRELAAVDLNTFFQVDGPAMFSWRADPAVVKEIAAPVLWIDGADSPRFFYESRDFLRELLPATKVVDIAHASHYFPVLKPVETATAVHDWLE